MQSIIIINSCYKIHSRGGEPFLLFKYGTDTLRTDTDVSPQPLSCVPESHYYVPFLFGITCIGSVFLDKIQIRDANELR